MKIVVSALGVPFLLVSSAASFGGGLVVKDAVSGLSDFPVVVNGRAAVIGVDKADAEVVRIAADLLAHDVERVSGVRPEVKDTAPGQKAAPMIVLGTLGKSALVAELVKRGKLDAKRIEGKWETFVIETITEPFPGVAKALAIAGSDRRGTAYGAISISEAIGVSPWEWWADVPPLNRSNVVVAADSCKEGPPSVKYRGIFLNDEDWGLQPWAAKTFEPERKDIGPKTYAKVCELLLRLKANYLWPAMHPCTKAFNLYPENKVVADKYGVVMGSSHAEPMLRNNVSEWTKPKEDWNYEQNAEGVKAYWEQRLEENGRYENTYTIGMRGIHDSAMPGGKTTADKVAILQRVIADQREMLGRLVGPKVEQVPQIFVPYKEVLTLYEHGLKIPGDVTLVWPDDNHGYIRRLSTHEEQKRSGGAGVYYHVSYWGQPEDYLWLCTTPPALVWEEMRKAYDNGARTVWVVNVGDLKPAEIDMEFFLRMAWEIKPWHEDSEPKFLAEFAKRNFGSEHATEVAAILEEYYRLNYPARPEHLLKAQFTTNYDEIGQRLRRFGALVEKANALYGKMSPERRDAFYELVVYPVRGSALMNEKHLSADPEKAQAAYDQIQAETRYYNEKVAGGKWNHMMSASPRNRPVFQKASSKTEPGVTNAPGRSQEGGYASMERPNQANGANGASWKTIVGLGRSGDSIALLPTDETVPATACLEYDFNAPRSGAAKVLVYAIPTHALHSGLKLRYAASIDNGAPTEVDLDTAEFSPKWSENVLRGAAIGVTEHTVGGGEHRLKIHPVDPGLVFDKIVIDFGSLEPSHLGAPDTRTSP